VGPFFTPPAVPSKLSVYFAPLLHVIYDLADWEATVLAPFTTLDIFPKVRLGIDSRFTLIPTQGIALHHFDPDIFDRGECFAKGHLRIPMEASGSIVSHRQKPSQFGSTRLANKKPPAEKACDPVRWQALLFSNGES
jgi:hypothetical protein